MHGDAPPILSNRASDRASARDAQLEATRAALAAVGGAAQLRDLALAVQQALGFVPPPAVPLLAARAGVGRASVVELIESDAQLSFTAPGRHRVAICLGRNCSQRGAAALAEEAKRTLGIDFFRVTPDFAVRLEPFYCFGRCQHGPNVRIDTQIHGAMTPPRLTGLLRSILEAG